MHARGLAFFDAIKDNSDLKVLASGDSLVSFKLAHLDKDKLGTGIAETVVDAPLEELAAWEFLKSSRESSKNFRLKGGVGKKVKLINDHCMYYASTRDLKVPTFKHREWRAKAVWKKEGENRIEVVYDDTNDLDEEVRTEYQALIYSPALTHTSAQHPRDKNIVAGSSRTTWEYERLEDVEGIAQTKVTFVSRVDIGGVVPNIVMNKLSKSVAKTLVLMRKKFDRSLDIDKSRR